MAEIPIARKLPNVSPLILIVEADPQISEVLDQYLVRNHFRTECVADGHSAIKVHRVLRPDVVLLDRQLPGMDGVEVLKNIQTHNSTPVIIISAQTELVDRLEALTLGADDYIVKPFNPLEVVARVKAVLRRISLANEVPRSLIRLGSLEVDTASLVVRVNGMRLLLTTSEYSIIEHLARHPNRTFSRSELLETVILDSYALERIVDTHIFNLRRKLIKAGAPELIETVRGSGYRLWFE
jgi:two-component system, OmpR family, response regulator AdeR